jgi:hypothetical protein
MYGIKGISARLRNYLSGQTKIDFAVIILAFAVVVYVGYETVGKAH